MRNEIEVERAQKARVHFEFDGRAYRWDEEKGLVRRERGKDVPIAGADSRVWQEIETYLLEPLILSAAVALGATVKQLEERSARATKKQPTSGTGKKSAHHS